MQNNVMQLEGSPPDFKDFTRHWFKAAIVFKQGTKPLTRQFVAVGQQLISEIAPDPGAADLRILGPHRSQSAAQAPGPIDQAPTEQAEGIVSAVLRCMCSCSTSNSDGSAKRTQVACSHLCPRWHCHSCMAPKVI